MNLKVGDKIRILCVPQRDWQQREREMKGLPIIDDEKLMKQLRYQRGMAKRKLIKYIEHNYFDYRGYTANTIEKIIEQNPIVEISEIDDEGIPLYEAEIGEETHSISILPEDNGSWELIVNSGDKQ